MKGSSSHDGDVLIGNVPRKYATGLVPDVTAPAGIQVVYGRKPGAHVLSLVNLYA